MADLGGVFNTNDYQDAPITDGEYKVQVTDCDLKETRAGGMMVAASYKILEGDFEGGFINDFFNIYRDDVAGQIAKKQFAKFANACGLDSVRDTNDLVNCILYVTVKNEQNGAYENLRVKKYRFYQPEQKKPASFNTSVKSSGLPF